MELLRMFRNRSYLFVAASASVLMFFILPLVQTMGLHTDLWYTTIPALNLLLFVAFCLSFGIYLSFMIYRFRAKKCGIEHAGGGIIGTAAALVVGACPACAGLTALVLPLGIVMILAVFGPLIMVVSICLMVFSVYLNGGFR